MGRIPRNWVELNFISGKGYHPILRPGFYPLHSGHSPNLIHLKSSQFLVKSEICIQQSKIRNRSSLGRIPRNWVELNFIFGKGYHPLLRRGFYPLHSGHSPNLIHLKSSQFLVKSEICIQQSEFRNRSSLGRIPRNWVELNFISAKGYHPLLRRGFYPLHSGHSPNLIHLKSSQFLVKSEICIQQSKIRNRSSLGRIP